MRLLIFGHHSHTGFGVVTEELGGRFVEAGVDVRVIAVNHRGEPVRGPLAGRVWPASIAGVGYGGNISHEAIDGRLWPQLDPTDEWRPDVVLAVSDVSGLLDHAGRAGLTGAWQTTPVFHYCPIEGDNLSVGWRGIWNVVRPVAMSDYGQRVIGEHIGRPVPRIYHGVDTETFRPVDVNHPIVYNGKALRSKEACKAAFGLDPGRKVILRTDRNVERKFYPALFAAMPAIFDADPTVDLVLHCRPLDEGGSLFEDFARLPEPHRERVKVTGMHDTWRGLPREGLVALMNAADLYLTTTSGEGFGLTLAESLAVEVPVVTNGWAAEVEVVGPGGVVVQPLIDRYGEPVRYRSRYGMDWGVPDPRAIAEATIRLLAKPALRRDLGRAGRAHVVRSFNWDTAAAEFLTLFEDANGPADRD